MSDDSSSSTNPANGRPVGGWGIGGALGLGFLALVAPSLLASSLLPIFDRLGLSSNLQNFVASLVVESLTIVSILAILFSYRLQLSDIGLGRFKLGYVGLAMLGFGAYVIASVVVSTLVRQFVPFDENQAQDVGFTSPQGVELLLVFVALVILTPLAEEILFRGFLFRGFRRRLNFWPTAIIISILFALAHFQVNVGLDVFALSLVLCYLREKTDSLWPGIVLHSTKNLVAFLYLYVHGGIGL